MGNAGRQRTGADHSELTAEQEECNAAAVPAALDEEVMRDAGHDASETNGAQALETDRDGDVRRPAARPVTGLAGLLSGRSGARDWEWIAYRGALNAESCDEWTVDGNG